MFIRYTSVMVSSARSISLKLCERPRNNQTCYFLAQKGRVSLLEDKHLLLLLRKNTRLLSLITMCTGLVPGATNLLSLAKVAPTLASVQCTMKIFSFHGRGAGDLRIGNAFPDAIRFCSSTGWRLRHTDTFKSDDTDTKRITGGTAAKAGSSAVG